MHAIGVPSAPAHVGVPRPPRWTATDASPVLRPEGFRERVEAEVARHDRYLVPFGLVRLGARAGREGVDALQEVVATEVRRTDRACMLPDGSCGLLILHAGPRQLESVAMRLMDAVAEIQREHGDEATALVAAIQAAGDRRVDAGPLWLTLSKMFEKARSGAETVVISQ